MFHSHLKLNSTKWHTYGHTEEPSDQKMLNTFTKHSPEQKRAPYGPQNTVYCK
jgi:hypothetical protein